MSNARTQSSIFAAEFATDTARELLDGIKRNAKDAEKVTMIALGVSMPHQFGYILSKAPLHWGSLMAWVESATLIVGAFGIPLAFDYLILICVRTLVARGAATSSKVAAFVAMLFPVTISATVNFIAPAPTIIRLLFGLVVILVPIAQGVRAMNRPDFRKIEAIEVDLATQVTQAPVSQSKLTQHTCPSKAAGGRYTPGCPRCDELLAKPKTSKVKTKGRKVAPRQRVSRDAEIADLNAKLVLPSAPVSPAPVGA